MPKQHIKSEKHGPKQFLKNDLPMFIPYFILCIYLFAFFSLIKTGNFNIKHLVLAFKNPQILKSFSYSIFIILISTFSSIIIGTIFVQILNKTSTGLLKGILYMPHFVMAFFVCQLFSCCGVDMFGIFSSSFGIPIIIAYILKQTPFVVFYILPVVEKISINEYECAKIMGASSFQIYKTVVLPKLLPLYGEIVIILISFISMAYEIPMLLGITFPKFLSVILYNSFFQYFESAKQEAVAIMIFFTLFMIILSLLLFSLAKIHRNILYRSEEIN